MRIKRCIAAGLAILVGVGLLLVGISDMQVALGDGDRRGGCPDSFRSAVTEIIGENWDQDGYFGIIRLPLEESVMYIDGVMLATSSPSVRYQDNITLPIADIATAIGGVVFVNDGIVHVAYDGAITPIVPAYGMPWGMASIDTVQDILRVDIAVVDDDVLITSPYKTGGLVLQTACGSKYMDSHGASVVVCDGSGLHFLYFDSILGAKTAYNELQEVDNIAKLSPNRVTNAVSYGSLLQPPLSDGWGAIRVSANLLKSALRDNGQDRIELKVAVIDTGIDANHPYLVQRVDAGGGYNYISDNNDTNDDNGHGTQVSGILADSSTGAVRLVPYKALNMFGTGTELQAALAIKAAADSGAKLINISMGSVDVSGSTAHIWEYAINYALMRGAISIVAAGNDRLDTKYVYPAGLDTVITVSASDIRDNAADFSNFGQAVDIAAPGVEILTTNIGGGYIYTDGTSKSTPFVCGVASMYIQQAGGNMTLDTLRDKIRATTAQRGLVHTPSLGAGILDCRYMAA